ncbi:MAG: hypothetical protein ABW292_03410 [Vicinamibacterales bacterium]
MSWRWTVVVGLVALGCTAPAAAQGTYVGAALTGDIVRFSHSETRGINERRSGGEAIGVALRVGTPLGSIWGVEAEFVYPSSIENESSPDVFPLFPLGGIVPIDVPGFGSVIYPPISYQVRTSWRTSTFSTGVWARHDISERVALVYSGGAAFNRTENEFEFIYTPPPRLGIITLPSALTETVLYSVRPFAGIGARIGMTEHLELVPSVRLQGLDSGMLVRPSIGLGWAF